MENLSLLEFMGNPVQVNTSPDTGSFVASLVSLVPPIPAQSPQSPMGASLLIVQDESICGGAPSIRGTRLSVHHLIAQMRNLNWARERVLESYPHLSLEQVDSAVLYYENHRAEIEERIERDDSLGT